MTLKSLADRSLTPNRILLVKWKEVVPARDAAEVRKLFGARQDLTAESFLRLVESLDLPRLSGLRNVSGKND
ncbi:MAG TPA: hypothetical protein VMF10_10030 [Candidatus Aquilonibacter sp.]|nr:hypothetical protein [Candidatus Aquilonibacter sp.]